MGVLSKLLGSGVIDSVSKVVDQFVESPSEANAHELKKMALEMQSQLQQIQVNEQEAKHASVFVAGWRPAIGWVCGAILAYNYIAQPLAVFAVRIWLPDYPVPPVLSAGEIMPVLLGMLGLGGMRSFEKKAGVHRDSVKAGSA